MMSEGCCLWVHRPTGRIVVVEGDGRIEFSSEGWNRLVFDSDTNTMVVEDKDEGQ